MINPSEINLSTLPSVPLEDRSQLPSTPCIYFEINFISQAKRAIARGSDPKDAWYIITQVWLLSNDADYAEGLELWEKLKPRILNEATL